MQYVWVGLAGQRPLQMSLAVADAHLEVELAAVQGACTGGVVPRLLRASAKCCAGINNGWPQATMAQDGCRLARRTQQALLL